MPSQSTLSADEKTKVKNIVSAPSHKIIFAALARIYYAYPQPNKWAYAGVQGALVFSLDNNNNTLHFKMVDMDGTRGVIWDHELHEGLELNQDGAFFLSFQGDQRMIGFVFDDESEAKTFHKKVKNKKDNKGSKSKGEKKKKVSKGGKIDKSMTSGPQRSFIHVGHMGSDANSGFTSKGVDPLLTALVGNLEGTVGKDVVAREMEFVKNFVREYPTQQQAGPKEPKKPKPPPLVPRRHRRHTVDGHASPQTSPVAQAPPPLPSWPLNVHPLPPRPPPPSRPLSPPPSAPPARTQCPTSLAEVATRQAPSLRRRPAPQNTSTCAITSPSCETSTARGPLSKPQDVRYLDGSG